MENAYTKYLENNGWDRLGPMSFGYDETNSELFFASSSSVELYFGSVRIAQTLLSDVKSLESFIALNTLKEK